MRDRRGDADWFAVNSTEQNGTISLQLLGELDLSNIEKFEKAIAEAERGANEIVVDLSELAFIDSTGLGALIKASQRAQRNGHMIQMRPGSAQLMRIFEITGLMDGLPWEPAAANVAGDAKST